MDAQTWAAWVSAAAAVAAVAGAAVAWWREHLSRAARDAARTAKTDAETAKVEAWAASERAERTLAAVELMADSLQGPPFVVTHSAGQLYVLRSNRGVPQSVEAVVNAADFVRLDFDTPVVLAAHQAVEFFAMGASGAPMPVELVLRVTGRSDPVHVPFG